MLMSLSLVHLFAFLNEQHVSVQVFLPQFCTNFSSFPCRLHAMFQLILLNLITLKTFQFLIIQFPRNSYQFLAPRFICYPLISFLSVFFFLVLSFFPPAVQDSRRLSALASVRNIHCLFGKSVTCCPQSYQPSRFVLCDGSQQRRNK